MFRFRLKPSSLHNFIQYGAPNTVPFVRCT